MKSHISFKWKSLDVISFPGKVAPFFSYLAKTNKKMETEKQNNNYVPNQIQANIPFLHTLKTSETLLFFWCVLGVEKKNIGLKWVDSFDKKLISIRTNATLPYKCIRYNFDKC